MNDKKTKRKFDNPSETLYGAVADLTVGQLLATGWTSIKRVQADIVLWPVYELVIADLTAAGITNPWDVAGYCPLSSKLIVDEDELLTQYYALRRKALRLTPNAGSRP